ncbi:MAG: hypothetical protein MJA31_17645 [Clostridia bacterium]|nr:hypothetical protein [Clostridia bacterium]
MGDRDEILNRCKAIIKERFLLNVPVAICLIIN